MNEIEKYVCSVCKKTFSKKIFIIRHLIRVHPDKTDESVRETSERPNPRRQKENIGHTSEGAIKHQLFNRSKGEQKGRRYTCSKCSYVTCYSPSLSRHAHLHDKTSKLYHCEFCSYASKQKNNLQRHLKTVHPPEADIKPIIYYQIGDTLYGL